MFIQGNDMVKLKVNRHKRDMYLKKTTQGLTHVGPTEPHPQRKPNKQTFMNSLKPEDLVPLEPIVI